MMIARLALALGINLGLLAVSSSLSASEPESDLVRFNRDVRPILSDYCFACHGPDANRREADLRLDTEEGLASVIQAGQIDQSELWRRVAEAEGEERMPPAGFGKDLPPEAIETLRKWIEQGAPWEGHWSFQPVVRPEVPAVENAGDRAINEIDAFVLQVLREQGLEMQQEADRRTLIRRLSLDLTGLPPTPEQVERFLADTAPGAYERLVDSLLESPHYGERMAMMWLDLVRYADSVGYHGDQEVSISPFRDYVIDSFNENVPFDRFTIEQLAGDLLPTPSKRQMVASGYNRLGMMSAEGGVQPKEYLAKYIAERVRNLGGTWMGVTLGCCECHDHKYDPFTAKDFYSFEAFFADIQEQGLYSGAHGTANWGSNMAVPTAEQEAQLEQLDRELAELRRVLVTETPELQAERETWESSLPSWTVLKPSAMTSDGGATLTILDDGSILAGGENAAKDVYRLVFDAIPAGVTGVRIEVLPDDSLPQRGPGRAGNGNFVLSELIARTVTSGEATPITFSSASATYEQTGAAGGNPYGKWAVAAAIDGDAKGPTWGWAVMEQAGQPNAAVFEISAPLAGGDGVSLELDLLQQLDNPQHNLGRFRVSVTTATPPLSVTAVPAAVAAALAVPAGERSDADRETIAAHHRTLAASLAPVRERITALEQQRQAVDNSIQRTLVTMSVEPRMVRVLARGNWMDESGEIVEPAFPGFLPGHEMPTDRRLTRLDLAHWLIHPDNPLTSRVFVNRLWKQFFGAGLSRKLDDLGSQGEWPSHPELLDWLAIRFVDSGWNVKEMVRTIVTSAAYRQSSISDSVRDERDPYNRWLSHQGRYRVDAEVVRDTALRVSGLLVDRLGGPSVRPYQPVGYWSYLNFPSREYQADAGDRLYRRGLYTHWQRQYLHPSLLAFDAPSREECAADRPRSNTPLQSLVLLNDPIYVEAARVFAERIMREGGESFESRVAWAYARAVSREPREAEIGVLRNLWERHRETYGGDLDAARQLTSIGAAPVASDLDPAELAAWTSVARTLLNLHETITRN